MSEEVGIFRAGICYPLLVKEIGRARTLIVIQHVSLMIAATVVRFPNAHGVVREVDITVVAWAWVSKPRGRTRIGGSYRRVLEMSAILQEREHCVTYI